ncbi:MAG: hypothetical protein NDJ90_05465 [Oligoflexia bacterium]|nr:hypothetical protein [Oligoflexia bacterium]
MNLFTRLLLNIICLSSLAWALPAVSFSEEGWATLQGQVRLGGLERPVELRFLEESSSHREFMRIGAEQFRIYEKTVINDGFAWAGVMAILDEEGQTVRPKMSLVQVLPPETNSPAKLREILDAFVLENAREIACDDSHNAVVVVIDKRTLEEVGNCATLH